MTTATTATCKTCGGPMVNKPATATTAAENFCPECKFLLNSFGLTGTLEGIAQIRLGAKAKGANLSPALYERLCNVICTAHAGIEALEAEIIGGTYTC